jgi:hypothetical protein
MLPPVDECRLGATVDAMVDLPSRSQRWLCLVVLVSYLVRDFYSRPSTQVGLPFGRAEIQSTCRSKMRGR